jgi:hypothetical protein
MKKSIKVLLIALTVIFTLGWTSPVKAATATVNLATAGNFAILAGSAVTNVPTSAITGNVGLYPAAGSFYDSGVTQAQVTGTIYSRNAAGPAGYVEDPVLLLAAKNDLTAAFIDAAGRGVTSTIATELGGQTLTSGVFNSDNTRFGITSPNPLILDGQGDPNAVFIFEMGFDGTGLTVGPGSTVQLTGGASACNVFWVVNTASINTTAVFKGNILALNSITVANGANIEGRLLARDANVTLISDTITVGTCGTPTIPTASPTTKLPKTGSDSNKTTIPLYVFIAAGVFTISMFIYIARRKQTT